EVNAVDPSTISASNFRASKKTTFIIHGFIDKGEESWLMDMCKAMLQVEDVNCFCIDWSGGSRTLYTQSANNIRVVGAEVAYFISILSVGLDPAEPYFQETPIEVRLDPSDASFVDVIHTDAAPMIPNLGFGMSQLVGHLDFFPNGGEEMPGCQKNALSQIVDIDGIWQGTRDFVACNHLRGYKYYTESIRTPDAFAGFPSSSYNSFKSGSGFPCPSGGCPLMGHYADGYTGSISPGQKFYLNTGEQSSYGPSESTTGSYTAHIDVESDVGPLNRIKFVWNNNIINPLFPTLGASSATIQYGRDGKTSKFCSSGTVREEVLQTLNPC
ncbi:hypothetical protein GDO78_016339, partial [Eleutherodactylus coqui]